MRRRSLLSGVIGASLSFAGCLAPVGTDLPDACPTSQDLGVEWPETLDAATVESFVETYEHVYYREVVLEYEPDSQLESYQLDGVVTDGPSRADGGWVLTYSGGGGIYTPTLLLEAKTATPPDGADLVDAGEVGDESLTEMIEEAAATGEAEHHVDTPGAEVDRFVDLLASLSDDFEPLSGKGDSDRLYVDVDGTTVEVTARASSFHGDYAWTVRYYVDEQVLRRTSDDETDPREGKLVECRTDG